MSDWTRPVCDCCWLEHRSGAEPVRVAEPMREQEICAQCYRPTRSGIYVRGDPAGRPFEPLR